MAGIEAGRCTTADGTGLPEDASRCTCPDLDHMQTRAGIPAQADGTACKRLREYFCAEVTELVAVWKQESARRSGIASGWPVVEDRHSEHPNSYVSSQDS